MAWAANDTPRWIFLGTDKGKGIYRAPWDVAKGQLGTIELAAETWRPNFFALHPTLPVLYTVNEGSGDQAKVCAFRFDKATGALTLLNDVNSHGDSPCFISVDHTGHGLFVADYSGGSVAAYRLESDGHLVDAGNFQCRRNPACGVPGPVKERQEGPHLHCVVFSPKNDFVLACDLGDDAIEVFPFSPRETELGKPIRITARAGSGPRHVAFHPNGKWVYCIHELDCTVDLYDWSVSAGQPAMTLREGSVIHTLANGTSLSGNTGCEIFVSKNGRFVYTCSRGVDEIVVYRVDSSTGLLTEQQRLKCGGPIPRYIGLDPSGKWLVSCNQGSAAQPAGNLAVFSNDPKTGHLGETPQVFTPDTPMFAIWI